MGFIRVGKSMKTHDRYQAFDVVKQAEQACLTALEEANHEHFGEGMPQPYRDKLNSDLDDCGHAYGGAGGLLTDVEKVLNGDTSPSFVSKTSQMIQYSSDHITRCLTTYVSDLRAAGVKLPGDGKRGAKRSHVSG
jgi:hypothetical protein